MDAIRKELLGFLMVLALFALACGLLEEDATEVTYEEQIPFSFTVDADEVCPDDIDCEEDAQPAPEDQELEPIEVADDIDVVEETGNEELREYAGHFESITVTEIEYDVSDNSLTFDLPQTMVYVDEPGSESREDDGVVELATIPSIPDGEDEEGTAEVTEANLEPASDLFQSLDFAVIAYGEPKIKEGQDLPPSGSAEVDLTIVVEFVANPQTID
ncbi:MAG: hypothetical protein ACOCV2_06445 [Persicimonas sp.]